MTERLITLLQAEAETLDVPPAPTAEILGTGRRLHRRRTRTIWGTAALTVVLVGGGAVMALNTGRSTGGAAVTDTTPTPSSTPPSAYAVGDTVYVGDSATPVPLPEVAQALYYTSAGLLVRTNKDGTSDGGSPYHFDLVSNDGTLTPLGLTLGDVVPSTDPTQPYLAWATMSGGAIQVVVRDVTTDQDIATVDVPGTFSWGGWSAPPVALAGDLVYVVNDHETEVVNWRTGEATTTAVVPDSLFPDVHGDHVLVRHRDTSQVLDLTTGEVLLDVPSSFFVNLSPDGRFATVSGGLQPRTSGKFDVYDVATGRAVGLPAADGGYGWTSDGDSVYRVEGSTLTICNAVSGSCRDATVPEVRQGTQVRYPGILYES